MLSFFSSMGSTLPLSKKKKTQEEWNEVRQEIKPRITGSYVGWVWEVRGLCTEYKEQYILPTERKLLKFENNSAHTSINVRDSLHGKFQIFFFYQCPLL